MSKFKKGFKKGYEKHFKKTGVELITEERKRQVEKEGWDKNHDREHIEQELAQVAAHYAFPVDEYATIPNKTNDLVSNFLFPPNWDSKWDKKDKYDRITQLKIAGALCAAEIDRLQSIGKK